MVHLADFKRYSHFTDAQEPCLNITQCSRNSSGDLGPPVAQGQLPRTLLAVGGKLDSLINGRLELDLGGLEHLGLILAELAEAQVLHPTSFAELKRGSKPLAFSCVALNVGALDDALLAIVGSDQRGHKLGTSHTHREGGRASASLGVDDLRAAVLDADGQSLDLLLGQLVDNVRGGLREQRQDGSSSVTADNRDVDLVDVNAGSLGHEGVGAHNVQRGHAEDPALVVAAVLLEHLCEDGHGGVDRVGDDGHHGVRAVARDSVRELGVERGVHVEKVLAGHAGLAGHARRDHHDVRVLESLVRSGQLVGSLLLVVELVELGERHPVAGHAGGRADVAEVCCHPGGTDHVEHAHVRHDGVHLQEHGQRLPDATGSTNDGDASVRLPGRRDAAAGHRLGGGASDVASEHDGCCCC